jgi:polyisoprenoid-binding protein YceI
VALLLPALLTVSGLAHSDWELRNSSTVSYVSIKNNAIAETNVFTGVTGGVNKKGQLAISIDLSSVETQVEIRNQRMRELFFEVARYPKATITAQFEAEELAQVDSGAPLQIVKPFTLSLHGVEAEVEAQVSIVAVGNRAWVSTVKPILISAGDFGLDGGVEALREIAGLQAISSAVPVSVDLRLQRKK